MASIAGMAAKIRILRFYIVKTCYKIMKLDPGFTKPEHHVSTHPFSSGLCVVVVDLTQRLERSNSTNISTQAMHHHATILGAYNT